MATRRIRRRCELPSTETHLTMHVMPHCERQNTTKSCNETKAFTRGKNNTKNDDAKNSNKTTNELQNSTNNTHEESHEESHEGSHNTGHVAVTWAPNLLRSSIWPKASLCVLFPLPSTAKPCPMWILQQHHHNEQAHCNAMQETWNLMPCWLPFEKFNKKR